MLDRWPSNGNGWDGARSGLKIYRNEKVWYDQVRFLRLFCTNTYTSGDMTGRRAATPAGSRQINVGVREPRAVLLE